MVVFKTATGLVVNYWQDELPDHDQYSKIVGQAIIDINVFKKNSLLFTGDYSKLLEACYKEQVYNDAVNKTLQSYEPTSTGETNV